ncbi:MAG: DUF3520 domain-containing protein [Pirellulaceae bacterium]|nr:DUF3520 domain-containing protein [Pirellulaceae bacterium]
MTPKFLAANRMVRNLCSAICCLALMGLLVAAVGCGSKSNTSIGTAARTDDMAPMSKRAAAPSAIVDFESESAEMPDMAPDEGVGPGMAGDQHDKIVENPFMRVLDHPLSTFSVDVDTASYSKVRQHLLGYGRLPRPDAVRIEELVNYFAYDYQPPTTDQSEPFATHIAIAQAPWNPKHRLARVALKGRVMDNNVRPASNLVLLVDTSGSMKSPNKLPLLQRALGLLLQQLNENDRVAVVAYAGSAGLVLDSTPATEQSTIMRSFSRLKAGGSTNGGQGLQLAYQIARDNFVAGGTNRILLCTDGDFNVGQTSDDQLVTMVEKESKSGIDLTVLGFGMGNLNDAMLEQISGKGNGNYAFIDTFNEARKVLQDQLAGTLVTIAKDVKIQVEFNPAHVAAYRLIGYENRMLESEDFNDDKKDAGEIGAGHAVTALYEIIPTGTEIDADIAKVDQLKYQQAPKPSAASQSGELLTLKLRYKLPGEDESKLLEHVVMDSGASFDQADTEFQFAAAVAGFGMLLRESEHGGDWTYDAVAEVAGGAVGSDPFGLRQEFLEMVTSANTLASK